MNWNWTRIPRPMERTLADDLKAALFVLSGSTLGYLVFGGGISLLLYCVVGAVISIVVMNILRRVKRPPRT